MLGARAFATRTPFTAGFRGGVRSLCATNRAVEAQNDFSDTHEEARAAQRHLLISLDDSPEAGHAVAWVLHNLYREPDVLHLLNAVPCQPCSPTYDFPNGHAASSSAAPPPSEEDLQAQSALIAKHSATLEAAGVPFEIDLLHDHSSAGPGLGVGDLLCERAKTLDRSVLVLTSHDKSRLATFLTGSISNYCMHESDRPVVVLHKHALAAAAAQGTLVEEAAAPGWEEPETPTLAHSLAEGMEDFGVGGDALTPAPAPAGRLILVGMDDSQKATDALKWTLEHVYRAGDLVRLLHVQPVLTAYPLYGHGLGGFAAMGGTRDSSRPNEDEVAAAAQARITKRFGGELDRLGVQYDVKVIKEASRDLLNSVASALCEEVKQSRAHLLVMGSHNKGPMEELLMGSVSAYCAHNSEQAVVVLH